MTGDRSTSSHSGLDGLVLQVTRPGAPDQTLDVQHGLTIGRGESNSAFVPDPDVAPLHARIIRGKDGSFEVVPESATAKLHTGDDDREVDRVPLAVGMKFRIGTATFICSTPTAPDEVTPKPNWVTDALFSKQRPQQQRPDPGMAAAIADLEGKPVPALGQIIDWLKLLHGDASCELRVKHAQQDTVQPCGVLRTPAGADREADGEHARHPQAWREHASEIVKLDAGGARGIYVTLHELDPDQVQQLEDAWCRNAWSAANEAHFLAYRWLMIDLDPVRPAGTPATNGEVVKANDLAWRIRADLAAAGWPEPVICTSGNGYYVLYRIHVVNDGAGKDLVRRCLHALAAKYPRAQTGVTVDTTTHDVARIIRVMGTTNRKGGETPERRWRQARLISQPDDPPVPRGLRERAGRFLIVPDELELVTEEQLQKLAATVPEKPAKATSGGPQPTGDRRPPAPQQLTADFSPVLNRVQIRFDGALQSRPDCREAIEGQGGRGATFAACCLAWRFAPTDRTDVAAASVVWELACRYNRNRCEPLWAEHGPDSLEGQWVSAWRELYEAGEIGQLYEAEPSHSPPPAPPAQQPASTPGPRQEQGGQGGKVATPGEAGQAPPTPSSPSVPAAATDEVKPRAAKAKGKGNSKKSLPPLKYAKMPFGLLENMRDVTARSVLCEIVEALGPSRTETTITYTDLARRVGASADTVTKRVKELIADETLTAERTGNGIRFQVLLKGGEALTRKAALERLQNGTKGFIQLLRITSDVELSPIERQVLGWFNFRTTTKGGGTKKIWVHQAEIAEQLGLESTGKSIVSRAITKLVELELIVSLGQPSRRQKTQYRRGDFDILHGPEEA